eukprot:jgi/Galph1/1250/GphlegSOOS_G5962.1
MCLQDRKETTSTYLSNISTLCVTCFGAGYVGLVTSACLADYCKKVFCLDSDREKIERLRQLQIPIDEPGLEEKLRMNYESGRLEFHYDNFQLLVRQSNVVFIAVGTPSRRGDGHADLSYVFSVAESICDMLKPGYTLIVIKSTVPIGTCRKVYQLMRSLIHSSEIQFDVVVNPEFLRQGSAVENFVMPDRIVVGGCGEINSPSRRLMETLYCPFLQGKETLFTTREEAEMIKYASNAFLAMKIQFINEVADFCQLTNADIGTIIKALSFDERIGKHYLQPGPGFGGSCLPKDIRALVRSAEEWGYSMRLMETVMEGNEMRKRRIAKWITQIASEERNDFGKEQLHTTSVYGRKIAILGLTFKANTDDLRDSPAVFVMKELLSLGAHVSVYDPKVSVETIEKHLDAVKDFPWKLGTNLYDACQGAQVVAILTEWEEFRELNWSRLSEYVDRKVVVDTRNLWNPTLVAAQGFSYYSVGRPPCFPQEKPLQIISNQQNSHSSTEEVL